MVIWHVWGDYVHTVPDQIGSARRVPDRDPHAAQTAEVNGFDMQHRRRIGYEPWAAAYEGNGDEDQSFAFAAYGTVRGWERQ